MGRARGLLLAGAGVALAEAATGTIGVVLLGPVEVAVYLLVCAAATAGITAVAARIVTLRRGDDSGEGEDGGGGPGGGGGDPPPWWPDFERDFWRHVGERERSPA
jgi:hypothetical protein